jgi:hypothetical protein
MPSRFAFRMRAYAAAHFEFDEVLTATWPDADATLQSEYTGGEDGRAYPVTILGEIRGEGQSFEEAHVRLANALGNTLPLIAVAANAAVANPLAVAAHGLDLTDPQPFMGYRTPGANEWFPPGNRKIDTDATLALVTAVGTHPQTDLLHRAMESYRRALGHWVPEEQLLAGEFLSISAETLSRFLIESRAAARGITPKNLVRLNKLDSAGTLRREYLVDEVFAGDGDALTALESASNGFEHGYMGVDDVRGILEPVLERSFGHVRRALIAGSGVEDLMANRLLANDYEEPRALVPVITIVQGELSRQDPEQPAAEMDVGPIELEWEVSDPVAVKRPDGKVDVTFVRKVTATKLPENCQLEISRFGMRAAHVSPSDTAAQVEVTRATPPEITE